MSIDDLHVGDYVFVIYPGTWGGVGQVTNIFNLNNSIFNPTVHVLCPRAEGYLGRGVVGGFSAHELRPATTSDIMAAKLLYGV